MNWPVSVSDWLGASIGIIAIITLTTTAIIGIIDERKPRP